MQHLIDIVETWDTLKRHNREFNQRDMREFVEQMNAMTRRMIRVVGRENAEFFESLAELCVNAQTLTTKGAKIIADGIDRTNV